METILLILFASSCVLFLLSFFRKEQNKEVERQIENFSITLMQEIYQLKKKIKVLEEEILIGSDEKYFETPGIQQNSQQKIIDLYENGYALREIAEITSIASEAVEEVITDYIRNGQRKEHFNE
ncbi:hypothetical protein ACJ2A9_05395 [Anaerobacillus sp. MEB173]|uniref:hypothetical protein n=1 Tax=Anaerobacillus sp. MEB173 TaxID=3383345 RepID=UPI003F8DF83A